MIRGYKEQDESQINQLFKEVFHKERSLEEWSWKFKDNPSSKMLISLYEDEDKIGGHVSILPIKVKAGEEEMDFGMRADTMVSPTKQGKGIYKKLTNEIVTKCKKENIPFLFGFPAPKAKELFQKYTGAKELSYIPRLVFVNNPAKLLMAKLPILKSFGPVLKFINPLMKKQIAPSNAQVKLVEVSEVDQRFDLLWEKAKHQFPILVKRDSTYLKWRYVNHPTRTYKIMGFMEGDDLEGFIVMQEQEKVVNGVKLRLGYIVDIFAVADKIVWETLILEALRTMSDSDMVSTWSLEHVPLFSYLKELGFAHKDSPMPLVGISLEDKFNYGYEIEKWFITPGDVDSF